MRNLLAFVLLLLLFTRMALASDGPDAPSDPGCTSVESPVGPFGGIRLGFGAWRGALMTQVQAGYGLGKVALGIVLEHNPFVDISRPAISAGAFGFGGFVSFRWQLTRGIGLRFEGIAGGSVLLFSTYGYVRGDVGLWLAARIMGLDVRVGKHAVVGIDVVDVSLPAFHLDSMPFIYPQWRWSISVAFM